MGLFNTKYDFETLIKKAATEPSYRAEFYKRLLTEKLVVLTQTNIVPNGTYTTTENTPISVLTLSDLRIPVFTSTDRIFDNGVIKTQVNFVELEGQVLLKMLSNKTILINPYSDYGKELIPSEIENILRDDI
jgi:hypothetical protein